MILRREQHEDPAAITAVHDAALGSAWGPPLGLLPPDPTWNEHFQVRQFSGWRGSPGGMFHYPAAFNRL